MLVNTSLPQIVDIVLTLEFRANVDTVTLRDQVRGAVVAYVNSTPVNGTLSVLGIGSVLQQYTSDGLVLAGSAVLAPAGNLVPSPGQTIRTTLANVSAPA